MFGFFRTKEVLAFAGAIASEYDRLLRSTALRQDTPAKRQQKFEKLALKVDQYGRENKLNFYKKSKMMFAIKEGLLRHGLPESEADAFLNRLIASGLKRR